MRFSSKPHTSLLPVVSHPFLFFLAGNAADDEDTLHIRDANMQRMKRYQTSDVVSWTACGHHRDIFSLRTTNSMCLNRETNRSKEHLKQ